MEQYAPLFLALSASYNFEQYQEMKSQGEDVTELRDQIKKILSVLPEELICPEIRKNIREFTDG